MHLFLEKVLPSEDTREVAQSKKRALAEGKHFASRFFKILMCLIYQ